MSILVKRPVIRWEQTEEDVKECEKYVERVLSLGS